MERITNIRISTLTKSVSHDGDVSIVSVGLNNGHVFAVDSEGNTHDMGAIIISNIEIATPQVASEGCGCNTPNANVIAKLLRGVDGVDGITPDMSDYYDKEQVDEKLSTKQDVIRDLEAIRSGAAKGATALQSVPSEYVTETELQNKGYATTAQVDTKQDKITDLDAIRQGAAKGATALQSETYTGTVTGVKVNGVTLSPDKGVVDVGDVIRAHQPLKTINGETIVGEGNIEIEGGSADLEGYATEEYVDNAVAEVNVKGEDGYVYSNGEKVDMRFTRSLIPVGTSIPAKANLNTVAYLKVGKYYCSLNVDAKTITNCPTANAFMMEVFNPLSTVVDNEVDSIHVYRIRIITEYSTGIQYFQYCTVGSTANRWTYNSWYVCPRTKFTLNSSKNDGSAALGSATQGVYINSEGTFVKMSYTLGKSVPSSAVFTDTKVTAVGNHYTPVEDASVVIEAPEGEVVIGLKRDAAGHVVGVMSTPMSGGGGGGGGIAVETDPIFSASPAATITEADKSAWSGKQDAISDLATIRSGAAKGATAVQPSDISEFITVEDIAKVATSGSYNDLHDKPTIPSAINIAGTNYTPGDSGIIDLNTAYLYRKPSGGIPQSDLSGEVQGALRKAEQYTGTVTEIKVNGNNIGASGGVVDLGNLGTYSKPSTGIPKSDLNPSVQTSLGKADTAVQPSDIKDDVYIADFTMESLKTGMNNDSQVGCDMQSLITALSANKVILVRESEISDYKGVYVLNGFAEDLLYFSIVDSQGNILYCEGTNYTDTYIDGQTLHLQDWWEKQDTLVSGENIKTINGESIVGSGNITISGGGGASGSAQLPANYISSNIAQGCIIPSGKVTIFTIPQTEGVTMRLSTVDMESGKDSAWVIRFSIGADNTGVYVVESEDNFSLKWANGIAPTFENGKYYEMSFRLIGQTFLGVWASFE